MIRNKCDNIFQWDTNLVLDVPASDIVYVDFQYDEIIRVAVEDGSCRIPDEILETAGKKILWLCHDDQTREQFIFNVKARPMPPDHIVTPTQRITFDSLVRDVRTSIEEADMALGAMMDSVDREVGDKMSSVDEKLAQVDEDVSDALASAQEATERAEDASEGAERVNIESERVADGVMVKTTDRDGNQTVTLVHDGQGGEGGSGMVEHKLTYTGSVIQFNGVTQTFTQVKDACLDPEKFVFVVYQNRLYIPQYVYNDRIFFTCTYQTDANGVQTRRIKMSSNGTISVDDVELATNAALEDLGEAFQTLNADKLSKPSSGIAVGKYFRVASIDDAGNPVLEAVDLPVSDVRINNNSILSDGLANIPKGTVDILGVVKLYGQDACGLKPSTSGDGAIATSMANNNQIDARNNNYRIIAPGNLRYAVDSVLCSTAAAEALTSDQKYAFWNRVEKPWVFKGSFPESKVLYANLLGCTEFMFVGSIAASGSGYLNISGGRSLVSGIANNDSRNVIVYFKYENGVLLPVVCKYSTSSAISLSSNLTSYARTDVPSLTDNFIFALSTAVTEFDLKLYAR